MQTSPRSTAFLVLLALLGIGAFAWLRQASAPAGGEPRPSVIGALEVPGPKTGSQAVKGDAVPAATAQETAFARCHVAWRRAQEPRLQALRERADADRPICVVHARSEDSYKAAAEMIRSAIRTSPTPQPAIRAAASPACAASPAATASNKRPQELLNGEFSSRASMVSKVASGCCCKC